MRKTIIIGALALLASSGLVSCNKQADFTVGILQCDDFGALNDARDAFIKAINEYPALKGKSVSFIKQNAYGKDSDQNSMAKSLVNKKVDLLLGISTGSSKALKNARDEAGLTTPLLFTAVTDPVADALVPSLKGHNSTVTGTSDDNPVEAQISMIKNCFPSKDPADIKLGILYSSDETNSQVQARRAQDQATKDGIGSVTFATVNSVADITPTARNLSNRVDVIYIPTDNKISKNMASLKEALDTYHTLCVVGEEGMVKSGGHLSYSINYSSLGEMTGVMGAQILSKEKTIQEIDATKIEDPSKLTKVYNSVALSDSGITLPASALEGFVDLGR